MATIVIRNKRRTPLTEAERLTITTAAKDALRLAIRVYEDMLRIWNQSGRVIKRRRRRRNAWKDNDRFTKWLGRCTRPMAQIRRVRRRIRFIYRWLRTGRLVFLVHDGSDRYCNNHPGDMAYVGWGRNIIKAFPTNALRIKLCPPWFTAADRTRATVLIHELVHHLGFAHAGGINNLTEAEALARRGSRRACRRARRSGYNYQGLYNEYW